MKKHKTSILILLLLTLLLMDMHFLLLVSPSMQLTSSSSNEWLIDYGASYHMAKDKSIFLLLMNVTPKNICW
jgi:hypothetical protein